MPDINWQRRYHVDIAIEMNNIKSDARLKLETNENLCMKLKNNNDFDSFWTKWT